MAKRTIVSPKRAVKKTTRKPRTVKARPALPAASESEPVTSNAAAQVEPHVTQPVKDYRATVRMYRHGLGDCFLVSLKRAQNGAPDYKILIDCGVILGTPDAATMMTNVVNDVVEAAQGKIDLLIATHEHWDHLSGFIQAADSFEKLKFDNVWVAWTEDPNDQLAQELSQERGAALSALQISGHALAMAGDSVSAATINDLLGFFGAAGQGTTREAFEKVKALAPLRYCRPTDAPVHLKDPDVRLYVLGPPHDAKLIRRTLSSKATPETYGLAMDGTGVMATEVQAALTQPDSCMPFNDLYAIPFDIARGMDFFRQYLWGPGEDAPAWRSIASDWLDSATDLALALDSATNNTSLVLAIELAGGDVLLFVADAQVGNWDSWQDLQWQVDRRMVTGPDLLKRTIFYKVGHHGSHNATLKQNGLELMANLDIAAIPVNHSMAVKKHWGQMPLPALVDALKQQSKGKLLRSDEDLAAPIDGVRAQSLYFEITF